MSFTTCIECNHKILERIGTVCPNCGHTVGYFDGNKNRKKYGKFFALSIFLPFISFVLIVISSVSKVAIIIVSLIYIALAAYSCPIRFKELFFTKYEKMFFWGIWILLNSLLCTMLYNLFSKF